jgi:hypothetical protein
MEAEATEAEAISVEVTLAVAILVAPTLATLVAFMGAILAAGAITEAGRAAMSGGAISRCTEHVPTLPVTLWAMGKGRLIISSPTPGWRIMRWLIMSAGFTA